MVHFSRLNRVISSGCMIILLIFLGITVPRDVSGDDFAGGDGTAANPYQIATVEQLQNMGDHVNSHFVLINDVDAGATSSWNDNGAGGFYGFQPVGNDAVKFTGSFNGQHYTISSLYINRPAEDTTGLFGHIETDAVVKNVIVANADVTGQIYGVSPLVGKNDGGTVSHCSTSGTVNGKGGGAGIVGNMDTGLIEYCTSSADIHGISHNSGGVIGLLVAGTVRNCSASGNITTALNHNGAGGFVGNNWGGLIENCFASGTVQGVRYVGGFAGRVYNTGTAVRNCFSTGDAAGTYDVGGFTGRCNNITLENCYSTGLVTVTGSGYSGGLVGISYSSTVTDCFWDTETSGMTSSAGGTGKTTAEMKDAATFTDTATAGLDYAWDFAGNLNDDAGTEDIWNISSSVNSGYPHLATLNEPPAADAGGPYTADEGSPVTLDASASSDPNGGPLQYRWDLDNDGTWDTAYSTDPFLAHTWDDDCTVTVAVEVYDGEFTDSDTAEVTVHNVDPALTISGPGSVDEGSVYTLNLSSSDPGQDTIIEWTVHWGDGDQTTVSGNPASLAHVYTDGLNVYTISASAADDDGIWTASNTIKVTVNNIAPAITLSGASDTDEGSVYTLNLISADPGDDTIIEWTVDWGDGTVEAVLGNPSTADHTYADGPNDYTISASASDEDGAWPSNTIDVAVHNVAPALTISGASSLDEGSVYTLNLSSSDPGDDTITEWVINWGDGSTETAAGNPVSITHTYADGLNHYTVTAQAYDEDRVPSGRHLLIVDTGNKRLIELDETDTIVWEYHSPGAWDCRAAERLANGNTLVAEIDYYNYANRGRVIEIEPDGTVVWEISGLNLPMDVERLANGNTLIPCQHGNRVIEVAPDKSIVWEMNTNLRYPADVERLATGNTLITDMYNDRIIEVQPDLSIVWCTPWGGALTLQDAKRLANGNTLVCSSSPGWNKVVEVRPDFSTAWEHYTYYPTDAERLENGNTLIAGGYGNYVKEVNPSGVLVWQYTAGLYYPNDVDVVDGTAAPYESNTLAISVHNVPPALTISGPGSVDEGSVYTLELSSDDPGEDTITEWVINWGDGTTETVPGDPDRATHIYTDGDNVYNISATATDEDGTWAAGGTVGVYVHDVPPLFTIAGPGTSDEGAVYTLSCSVTDPGDDTPDHITIDWGDGSTETTAGCPASVSHTYADGPALCTISAGLTNEDGTFPAQDTVEVQVLNVAPDLTITGPSAADEGAVYTLGLSSSDPGQDTIIEWTVHWGDGDQTAVSGNPASLAHVYTDGLNVYTISASAADDDGIWTASNTIKVTVNNIAPAITLSGASDTDEGSVYTLGISVADPGDDTISQYTVDWGDGTAETVPGTASSAVHTYADGPDNYTISASGTDEDGTHSAENTVDVTVHNVAPAVSIDNITQPNPYCILPGDTLQFSGSFTDPGVPDTHTIVWDFGDGTPAAAGTLAPDHAYAASGEYTATLTVTDKDGDAGSDSCTVTVCTYGQVIENISEILEGLDIPDRPRVLNRMKDKALQDLLQAQQKMEQGNVGRALHELGQAVQRLSLISRYVDGADGIITMILSLTDRIVSSRIVQAVQDADSFFDVIMVRMAQMFYRRAVITAGRNSALAMTFYRSAFIMADRVR